MSPLVLEVEPHPLLELRSVVATWPVPLGEMAPAPWLDALVGAEGALPLRDPQPSTDEAREAVRALLRYGGYKPAGRGKPCSEYVRHAVAEGRFPRIGPVVDLTNLAALHGGLPVSTVDLDRLRPPLRVALAEPGASYVFNASGQTIALGGLLCLHDAEGPAANAVKDAQRAKTTAATTRTLTLVWGTRALPGRADALLTWLEEGVALLGGRVERG